MDNLKERLRHAADTFAEQRDDALSLLYEAMDAAESSQNAEIVEHVIDSGILGKLVRADAMAMFEMALPAVRGLSQGDADSLLQRFMAAAGGATVDDLSRHLPELRDASTVQQMLDRGADPNFVVDVDEKTGIRTTALGQSMSNKNDAAFREMICYLVENDEIPLVQYNDEAPQVGSPGTVTAFDRLISYTAAGWTAEIDVFDRLQEMTLSTRCRGAIGRAVLDYNERMQPGTMGAQCLGATQRKILLLSILATSDLGGPQGWLDVMQPANDESPNLAWTCCVGLDAKSRELGQQVLHAAVEAGLDPSAMRAVFKGGRSEGNWLSASVYNHNSPMTQALLEAGVDPYQTINLTDGPLNAFEVARTYNNLGCQQILEAWVARNAITNVLQKARAGRVLP